MSGRNAEGGTGMAPLFTKVGTQQIDPTSIEVAYRHEQDYLGFRDQSAQTWSFDAHALPLGAGDNDAPVIVARGEALTVRLHGERNPYDALDEHSEGARRVGEAVFEESSGEFTPEFERLIEGLGDRVLVVTELEVERQWRGHGLGPLIGGLAIDALSGGAVAVLCWPAPLHRQRVSDGTERDLTDDERDAAVAKLARMWSRLGFVPFRDGVHYIDTACLDFRQSLEQVLAETVGLDR